MKTETRTENPLEFTFRIIKLARIPFEGDRFCPYHKQTKDGRALCSRNDYAPCDRTNQQHCARYLATRIELEEAV